MENKNAGRRDEFKEREMNRREMLKKSGRYAVVTSVTTFLVLSPKSEAAGSIGKPTALDPIWYE